MKDEKKSKNIMSGMVWAFGERISAQIVSLAVSIVLARLLSPSDYAVVAIVTIFITVANVFVSSGFGNALIQKINADELDFSTTFYVSFGVAAVIYAILFLGAPAISSFYNLPDLTFIIRVMALRIIIASYNTIQQAYVSRNFAFKKFFFSTLAGTVISAVVGITAAYCGAGVWALVAQYLTNVTVDTVVLSFTCDWKPKWMFSAARMRPLFSYGWKVLVTDLISTLYEQLRGLVLSKTVSSQALAYYNQGEKFPALFINNIETSVHKVMMPVVSKAQEDKARVLELTRKSMSIVNFMVWPLLIGLAVVAEPLIKILYTDKWLPSVPYLQLICITYLMNPIIETHTRTIKALGRSDLLIKMTIVRYVIGSILLAATVVLFRDPMLIVGSWTVSKVVAVVLCGRINKKLCNYKYGWQLRDILGTFVSGIFMGTTVRLVMFLDLSAGVTLVLQIAIGMLGYLAASMFFNRKMLKMVAQQMKVYILYFKTKNHKNRE